MSDASRARALAEVQNLYARYAHTLDEGAAERFMDCFTADAAMWPNTGPFQPDRGRFTREALEGDDSVPITFLVTDTQDGTRVTNDSVFRGPGR